MQFDDLELSTSYIDDESAIIANGSATEPELYPENADAANKKVLVLEDDPTQLFLLTQHLESIGLSVVEAKSIAEAKMALAEHAIQMAVLDVHLPDGSGLDLCARIDDSPSTAGMPIVVLSSVRQDDIVRQTRRAGGCYFISKPYDPNVLLAVIEKLISEY